MARISLVCVALVMAISAQAHDLDLQAPAYSISADKVSLWSTRYYISTAIATDSGKGIPVLRRDGVPLGYELTNSDFCFAALQGTARIAKPGRSTVINADGLGFQTSARCTYRGLLAASNAKLAKQAFVEVPQDAPAGLGTTGYRLVPYRTIAVDRRYIGTAFFIPALRGTKILTGIGKQPDGSSFIHDGYVFGGDVGDAIKGNHTDFFTGFSHLPAPPFVTSSAKHPYVAYVVRDQATILELEKLHRRDR